MLPNVHLHLHRSSATNRLIGAGDHASVQFNVAKLDENGVMTGEYQTYAISGAVRSMVRAVLLVCACPAGCFVLSWPHPCTHTLGLTSPPSPYTLFQGESDDSINRLTEEHKITHKCVPGPGVACLCACCCDVSEILTPSSLPLQGVQVTLLACRPMNL